MLRQVLRRAGEPRRDQELFRSGVHVEHANHVASPINPQKIQRIYRDGLLSRGAAATEDGEL